MNEHSRKRMKKHDMTCYCSVCDRSFQYGDATSPVFTDDIWKFVVSYYNLNEHEKYAAEEFIKLRGADLSNRNAHTFICVDCTEKALRRRLLLSDVTKCMFNREFLMKYFGYTQDKADEICG